MKQKTTTQSKLHKKFLAFLRSESARLRQTGHIHVANNYRSACNSFSRFLQTRNQKDIPLKKITPLLINDYEAWLQADRLCKNTTSFYIRALQSAYNKAVSQHLTNDCKPFAGTYRGVARTIKRAIDPNEIYRLKALDIRAALMAEGHSGKRLDNLQQHLEFARDIFIFCFCARGLTFVDLAHMQKSNIVNGFLTYVRRKTKQRIEVQIEPMMQNILDKYPSHTDYLLPILNKTGDQEALHQQYRYMLSRYNNHLKILGAMLGGLKLTSYVSRHSWASTAYRQNVSLSVISQSMGHDSEKTTEIYLKSLESNIINRTNHELLANVFKSCRKH